MLTSRGWWLLVVILCLLALGLFDDRWSLTLLAMTLLLWFLGQWFLFGLRLRLAVPCLQVQRTVSDERGSAGNLWAGRTFHVRVQIALAHWLGLPHVRVTDFIPLGVELADGIADGAGVLDEHSAIAFRYSFRCVMAGRVRFEGVRLELADLQGFFYHTTFIPGVVALRVLPALADARGRRPSVKRNNLLPSPGLHRHKRPGSGSELLDLRDYLPGDPPKTIAWKVSARRDRLITKEFESEVPLRCTFFLDISHSVRLGPPGYNALARLVDISATCAQAASASRDLSGLCLFDDDKVTTVIRPARGTRHLVGVLNVLADAAGLAPATGAVRVHTILPLAYALAQEIFPYLLRDDVNQVPAWLSWLWPMPALRRAGRFKIALRFLLTLLGFVPLALCAWLCYVFSDPLATVLLPVPETMLLIFGVALLASAGILYYALMTFLYRALALTLARRRRQLGRWRKQIATLLASRYELGAGGVSLLIEDDEQCVLYLQLFLTEHQVPYPVPLYDLKGRYLFRSPGKVTALAKGLLQAVGKGRDNELFVLLVDLLELEDDLAPLLRSVKITLARHHQVVVIRPWPPGVPPPRRNVPRKEDQSVTPGDLQTALHQAAAERLQRAFHKLRREFARLSVPVVCAEGSDPVRLILDRLDRLRSIGTGRRR